MTATAPRLTELDFQRQLVGTKPPGLAVLFGWEHVHFRPAMTKHGYRTAGSGSMAMGWPDLVLARQRDQRLIFVELKRDGEKPTDDQRRVLELLAAVSGPTESDRFQRGIEVYVWHPSDLDAIQKVLR